MSSYHYDYFCSNFSLIKLFRILIAALSSELYGSSNRINLRLTVISLHKEIFFFVPSERLLTLALLYFSKENLFRASLISLFSILLLAIKLK
ncbi:MAG: hypothetical protein CM15mP93_10540 [Thiotrichaceae bacterium]|nr:MAG: hypothetical protein CM15mP93_10540 [Thiotrichaceae bacterium]